jgi:cobalamin biosynthesis Mg chelatase CobN
MKLKKTVLVLGLLIALAIGGYIGFKIYMERMIAKAIVSTNELPAYLPEKVREKVKKVRIPVNQGADVIINTMHQSKKVTLDQILKAIDNVTEEQAFAMLELLNNTKVENTDQVFDMAKKQFPVDFDVEIFRKAYHEKVSMRLIKKAMVHGNRLKENQDMDFESARSILKQILIQKEKDFTKVVND